VEQNGDDNELPGSIPADPALFHDFPKDVNTYRDVDQNSCNEAGNIAASEHCG
jgi:hypothetical protein